MKSILIFLLLLTVTRPGLVHAADTPMSKGGPTEVRVLRDATYIGLSLLTPTTKRTAQGTIDATESYAVSPLGKRFGIIVRPDRAAHSQSAPSYYTSDYVWLRDASGHELAWTNGDWQLFIVLRTKGNAVSYRTKVHIQNHISTKYIEADF